MNITRLQQLLQKPVTDFNPSTNYGQINLCGLVQELAAVQRNAASKEKINEIATFLNQYTLNLITTRAGRPKGAPTLRPKIGYVVRLHNHNDKLVHTARAVADLMGRATQSVYNKLSQKSTGSTWVHFNTTDENGNPAYHSVRKATQEELTQS